MFMSGERLVVAQRVAINLVTRDDLFGEVY
jgi:hypothetical protein